MAIKIKVYSTPTCPYCLRAKEYLREQGVDFEEYDVAADREKAREMVDKSGQMGVPVIDIDGDIIVGFDKQQIDAALSRSEVLR
jgi:glutaredoxin 3